MMSAHDDNFNCSNLTNWGIDRSPKLNMLGKYTICLLNSNLINFSLPLQYLPLILPYVWLCLLELCADYNRWFVQINAILTKLPQIFYHNISQLTNINQQRGWNFEFKFYLFFLFTKPEMILLGGAGTVKTLCLTLLWEIKRFLKPALLMLHTADSWFDIYPSLFNLWMKWSLNLKITFESNISGLFPPHRGSVELGHSLCFDVEINFNTHIA